MKLQAYLPRPIPTVAGMRPRSLGIYVLGELLNMFSSTFCVILACARTGYPYQIHSAIA